MRIACATLAVALLAACTARSKSPVRDDNPTTIFVLSGGAVIKSGGVGTSDPTQATYVLVDVENQSREDRLVTLEGSLRGAQGEIVTNVGGVDEIRVPAGGRRTFALVSDKVEPNAVAATFKVANAVAVDYPPQVKIADEKLTPGPVPVVTATARNMTGREVEVLVAAAFHDGEGRLLTRPFTIIPLPIGATRPLRFEGPAEAKKAMIFVGQVAYH